MKIAIEIENKTGIKMRVFNHNFINMKLTVVK